MPVAADEVARILTGLGISIVRADADAWICYPPSFRPDLSLPVDMVEEVMRHHGLDALRARHSNSPEELVPLGDDPRRMLADAIGDGLRGEGLHEHISLAFISDDRIAPVAGEFAAHELVRPINPMSNQQACMRPHLLPGLLDAVARNHVRHTRELGLFEVGRIYRWPAQPGTSDGSATAHVDPWLPREPVHAAVIRARRAQTKAGEVARVVTHDLLATLARVGLHAHVRVGSQRRVWLHPGIQAQVWIGDVEVGVVGELHPDLLAERDLAECELAYGELWIEALPPLPIVQFEESARFPATDRDLSLDLSLDICAQEAVSALLDAAAAAPVDGEDPPRLSNADDLRRPVLMVEDYRGEGVEPGRRALLLRLHYRATQRSVTDAEVQALHEAVISGALARLRQRDAAAKVR
jgi:phenylalanyl-tRNA synthetase beta chain